MSNLELINILLNHRKSLLYTLLFALIVSVSAVYIIPSKYKASSLVFPSKTLSNSKLLLTKDEGEQEDYLSVGEDQDVQRLQHVLESKVVLNSVNTKLNLIEHYKIKDQKHKQYLLENEWRDNVDIIVYDRVSLKIEVCDVDRDFALNINKSIMEIGDSVKKAAFLTMATEASNIVKSQYAAKQAEIKVLTDSLNAYRKLGVLNPKEQIKQAIKKGNVGAEVAANTYGVAYEGLYAQYKSELKALAQIKRKLDEANANLINPLPSKFIIDEPSVSDKAIWPNKSMIVLFSLFSAAVLFLLFHIIKFKLNEL